MKDIKGMGEITVKAFFVKNLQTSSFETDKVLQTSIKEVGRIPEKALKGRSLSHQAS
jgi:copper chaperone CopZ